MSCKQSDVSLFVSSLLYEMFLNSTSNISQAKVYWASRGVIAVIAIYASDSPYWPPRCFEYPKYISKQCKSHECALNSRVCVLRVVLCKGLLCT